MAKMPQRKTSSRLSLMVAAAAAIPALGVIVVVVAHCVKDIM